MTIKTIKIILPIALFALIGFFVWAWMIPPMPVPNVPPPTNQYVSNIEGEITELANMSVNNFSVNAYKDIQYHIEDNYKKRFLGSNESDNNQWKEILSKNLYSAYVPKFIEQSKFVLNGSAWKVADLKFIRTEVGTLKISVYLQQDSPVAREFKEIESILEKYDEISDFITNCNNFFFGYYGINDRFPDVSDKIQKSRTYLKNNLENPYVNNCARLKEGLREVPKKLFEEHINYLQDKIRQNSGSFRNYSTHKEYSEAIYTPLRNHIDALDNDIYGVGENTFSNSSRNLENLLSADNRNAIDYFRSLNNQ